MHRGHGIDLIVVGSHGKDGIKGMLAQLQTVLCRLPLLMFS